MIRSLRLFAAALCIAAVPPTACGPAIVVDEIDASTAPAPDVSPIERVESAYGRLRGASEILLMVLPQPYADQVRLWRSSADRAIELARTAGDVAEQLRALRQLEAAGKGIEKAAVRGASAGTGRVQPSAFHPS